MLRCFFRLVGGRGGGPWWREWLVGGRAGWLELVSGIEGEKKGEICGPHFGSALWAKGEGRGLQKEFSLPLPFFAPPPFHIAQK